MAIMGAIVVLSCNECYCGVLRQIGPNILHHSCRIPEGLAMFEKGICGCSSRGKKDGVNDWLLDAVGDSPLGYLQDIYEAFASTPRGVASALPVRHPDHASLSRALMKDYIASLATSS